jgi:hypothetical protein
MKFYFHRIDATIGIEDLAVECERWFSRENNSDSAPPPTPITSVKILRAAPCSFRSRWVKEFSPIQLEMGERRVPGGEGWTPSAEGDVCCPQLLSLVREYGVLPRQQRM